MTRRNRQTVTVEPFFRVRSAHTPVWFGDDAIAYLFDATGVPQVWQVDPRTGETQQLTDFRERVGALIAAPSGERLVFGMDAGGDERQQLWVIERGGQPRALTDDPAVIHSLGRISPDGNSLAFASNARDQRFFDVHVVDLIDPNAGPRPILATEETLTPVGWSPDGRHVLVDRANTNLDHDLLLLPAAGGEATLLTPHDGEASMAGATFHLDGQHILLLSNQDRDLTALVSLDPAARRQTPLVELDWDVEGLAVSPDGGWAAYGVNEDGATRVVLRSLADGEERTVDGLPLGIVEGLTWSPSGRHLAFAVCGPQHPYGIWVCGTEGRARRVTAPDLAGLDAESFVEPEIVRYPTFDGRQIPAFWYRPAGGGDGRVPVVIDIHGGPEGQRRIKYDALTQFLVARGYAVLATNVRGSTGYGKAYSHLDDVEKRMDAVADISAAADWLTARSDAAPGKIAIYGVSYGGFMVLASATTYPDRWAAVVDVVGIANFQTFFEQTGTWRRRLRAAEYGDPERDADFLREISPLHKADRITAPLFVIHGRNDPRVPVGEAEQIVSTLRGLGRDVELRIYEDEGHGLIKLPNKVDGYGAVADFLDRVVRRES